LTLSFFSLILVVQAAATAKYTKKGKLFMDDLTKEQQNYLGQCKNYPQNRHWPKYFFF
jgi:cell fate regulator YaaT (PSP1 superfamily)